MFSIPMIKLLSQQRKELTNTIYILEYLRLIEVFKCNPAKILKKLGTLKAYNHNFS
jgi:branched-subunit amino acid permease